ncbi:unnamed protein product [Linum trigynum]
MPVTVTRERERATMGVGCPLLRRLNCALLEKEVMAHMPSRKEKKIGGGRTLCSSSVGEEKPKKKSPGWTSSALVHRSPEDERKKERAGGGELPSSSEMEALREEERTRVEAPAGQLRRQRWRSRNCRRWRTARQGRRRRRRWLAAGFLHLQALSRQGWAVCGRM